MVPSSFSDKDPFSLHVTMVFFHDLSRQPTDFRGAQLNLHHVRLTLSTATYRVKVHRPL